jgi:hypothetical protein
VIWVDAQRRREPLEPRTWSFGYYRAEPSKAEGLSHNYVTAFAVGPQNRLWVGTLGGGLNVLDRRTGDGPTVTTPARRAASATTA